MKKITILALGGAGENFLNSIENSAYNTLRHKLTLGRTLIQFKKVRLIPKILQYVLSNLFKLKNHWILIPIINMA